MNPDYFRSLFEHAAAGIVSVSLEGRLLLVNPALCQMLGYSQEELLNLTEAELVQSNPTTHSLHYQLLLAGTSKADLQEEQWIRQDRSILWVKTSTSLVRNENGEPAYFIKVVQDISEHKYTEAALRRQLNRALLLQNITDAIRSPLDPQQIFEATVTQVGRAFNVTRCLFLTHKTEAQFSVAAEYVEPDDASSGIETLFAQQSSYVANVLAQDQAVVSSNVYADCLLHPVESLCQQLRLKSMLAVRTSYQGEPNGILVLQQCNYFRDWTNREIQLLEAIAAQVGIALAQVRLLDQEKTQRKAIDQQNVRLKQEVQKRKQAERQLEQRQRYLAVLVEIQRYLLASHLTHSGYIKILEHLGKTSGADRVYLFERHYSPTNSLRVSQRAEWCAQGISSEKNNPVLQNFPFQDLYPRWTALLANGERVAEIVRDLPESEREILETQGIQSVLVLPLMVKQTFWGFIGFDNCTEARHWTDSEINLLSVAASAISLYQERQQAEAALEQAKEAAESANHAKSEFLTNISHELRTPLNAILGFTQVMSHSAFNPKHQEYINIINRSGQHLLKLINDVLEMSKIEAGRHRLNPTSFDFYRLLEMLYEMLLLKAQAKHLNLTFEIAPEVPQHVTTDEGKLRQVLLNLLGNAIKFTEEGEVTLRVGTKDLETDSALTDPLTLTFEVKDSGLGIDPAEMIDLFTPFMQTYAGQQSSEGTGLGLAISQKFVQLMGGTIAADSVPGEGSCFQFDIVVRPAQPHEFHITPPAQHVLSLDPQQPPCRILVVEDCWENRQLLMELLQPVGFEVKVAVNGVEAIQIWQNWHPHLILMDIRMPVMDGYHAIRQIRQQESNPSIATSKFSTKIIAITSHAFEEDRIKILSTGCDDFISKPFQEELMFTKLAEHLDISYIYRTTELATPSAIATVSAREQAIKTLNEMPISWISKLHEAAIQGRDQLILELIQVIPEHCIELKNELNTLAKNFQFEDIIHLILTE